MKKKALALLMTSIITLSATSMPVFNGLLQGYDSKIRPQDSLKRAELATVINNAFNSQNKLK